MRAIPERLRGVITTRCYTNPRLPFTFTSTNRARRRLTLWIETNTLPPDHYSTHVWVLCQQLKLISCWLLLKYWCRRFQLVLTAHN